MNPKYSVIIPVYNRPDELDELLGSLTRQTRKNFEVIIVEDGSSIPCETVVKRYDALIPVRYFYKKNEGPGPARNFGYQKASGEYFVVFDSDCIIPPEYFSFVDQALIELKLDAWGGPDRAHEKFTPIQRAMGYTMSSVLTTGGIRGGKKRLGWFQPRSFNMGISAEVFERTGGFKFTRFAEDIEFSIRMKKAGFKVGLIEEAFVYHKRRTNFIQFYKQVSNFGKGRALLGAVHPEEIKITHWFPTCFTVALVALLVSPWVSQKLFIPGLISFIGYLIAIFFHSLYSNKNIWVAVLSVPSALLQLTGYGMGFVTERLKTYFRS
jgi:glycosyltransferase involved in cell wall biosynthesis